MKTYTVETRGVTTCPAWHVESCHSSDNMAISYWEKFFTQPSHFPASCYQLVIFEGDRLVAELFQNHIVEVRRLP